MKEVTLLLVCFILSLSIHTVYSIQQVPLNELKVDNEREITLPFLVWSDAQLFKEKNAQIVETLTAEDIEDSLYSILQLSGDEEENTKIGVLNKIEGTPEILIVFVEPELRTDLISKVTDAYSSLNGGSLSNLKKIISLAASTVTVPYVGQGSAYSSLLDIPLVHLSEDMKQGSILVARDGDSSLFGVLRQLNDVKTVSINGLIDYLTAHNELATNGVTDAIVVAFENPDKLALHDVILGEVSEVVSKATSGNYVGIFTANAPTPNSMFWTFPSREDSEQLSLYYPDYYLILDNSSNTTNTTNSTKTNYFPSPILEAYMVILPLLTMLFVGFCGIWSLQVPEKFETPKVQKLLM